MPSAPALRTRPPTMSPPVATRAFNAFIGQIRPRHPRRCIGAMLFSQYFAPMQPSVHYQEIR